ncbi:MAG: circularly permuted type 2 ATP-grasp protein, partial [Verrucomicrobiota bacterium]
MTAARPKRRYQHLKPPESPREELYRNGSEEASPYAPILDVLETMSPAELRQRQERLDRAARNLGTHFEIIDEKKPREADWQLDLFPRVISREEWDMLSAGILQRARAFNAYIHDLYNDQVILKQRMVSPHLALADPAFQRPLTGVNVPNNQYVFLGAFDLLRQENGQWRVLENHMATSFGLSFVMQNRRMLAQGFPEVFQPMDVSPVAPFISQFSETLRTVSEKDNPHIVLLTRGETNQAYFDESFLARQLGIAMVSPADLLIREGKVYLKTIRGLEQVDVIYRRLASAAIDPIAFAETGYLGIPGIVNCVRKGTVRFVNALGSGVADNRALLRHTKSLITFYLNEQTILEPVPSYNCGDIDQFEYIMSHEDEMVFKPIQDHYTLYKYLGGLKLTENRSQLIRLAKKWPHLFIAQPYLHPSQLPCHTSKGFESSSVFLRVFFQLGDKPSVLPGGLTRQSRGRTRPNPLTIMSDGMKDTWVPGYPYTTLQERTASEIEPTDFSISSRVAESLYWMGRYLQRFENTARQLNLLETLRWDQLGRGAQRSYWPLWKAVAAANGKSDWSKRKSPPKDTLNL